MFRLIHVSSPEDWSVARRLFELYAESLPFALDFQGFAAELERMGEMYGPPAGCLFLARARDATIGCVGVRRLDAETAELKRLFVVDGQRKSGAGRALTQAAIEAAQELGYRRIRLDTVPSMGAARALYRSLGFVEIEPYAHNPVPGTSFMELELD